MANFEKAVQKVIRREGRVKFVLEKVSRCAAICNNDRTQSKFLLAWINRTLESR